MYHYNELERKKQWKNSDRTSHFPSLNFVHLINVSNLSQDLVSLYVKCKLAYL